MRIGPLTVIVLAVLLSIGAALAGYLQAEAVSFGADGTTFRAWWSVGVTTDYSVVDKIGREVTGLSPLVVNEGPNSCNDDHPVSGNGRAYFVSIASDDTGPQDPDGYVNCEYCDCEAVPETNYWDCNSPEYSRSDGRCQQCDACRDSGGNADCAANTNGETACDHVSCKNWNCICDSSDCGDLSESKPSCEYSGTCDESAPTISWDTYACDGDNCKKTEHSDSCNRDRDGRSCGTNKECSGGSCTTCECDGCRSKTTCPSFRACVDDSCKTVGGAREVCPEDLNTCADDMCDETSDCQEFITT